jgi:hypothetical protein
MNLKLEITKKVLDIVRPGTLEKDFKKYINLWWVNPRNKDTGGLRLSKEGYEALLHAGIKEYVIKYDDQIDYTSQLILLLDRQVNSPFYLSKTEVTVFEERLAVQLVLFSGNIVRYSAAKANAVSH